MPCLRSAIACSFVFSLYILGSSILSSKSIIKCKKIVFPNLRGFEGDFISEPVTGFVDEGVGGFLKRDAFADDFDDLFAFFDVEDEEDHPWQGSHGLTNDDLLIPLSLEPKVGESVPGEEFFVGADAASGELVESIFGDVGGEDVGEESEGHDHTNEQEFFKKEKNDSEEKRDREDGGVELAGADFVGPGRRGPLEKDFFGFDIFGDIASF